MRWRWSLVWRMGVAVVMLSVISVFIASLAILLTGLVGFLLLLALAIIPAMVAMPFVDDPSAVFGPLVNNWVVISLVIGLLALPVVYVRPARQHLREFRRDLGTGGRLVQDEDHKVRRFTRQLAQQADIPEPKVFIADRNRPESYALGGASGGTIVVTKGLVGTLADDELEAVLAHEISHLVNGDSRVIGLALIPMLLAEHVVSGRPPVRGPAFPFLNAMLVLVWAILRLASVLLQVVARFGVALLSRGREFEADRAAAMLTGSPEAVASALQTLTDERSRPKTDKRQWHKSASALDILPPTNGSTRSGLFRTHPSTERRLQRLEGLVVEIES